jgi:hypothetical protein
MCLEYDVVSLGNRGPPFPYRLHLRSYSDPNYNHIHRHLVDLTTAQKQTQGKDFDFEKLRTASRGGGNLEILKSNSNYVLSERIAQVRRRTRKNFYHMVPQISVHMDQVLRKYRYK